MDQPSVGPKIYLGRAAELSLDGYYLRSVILEGMTIHYNGGSLILENVTFINCQFVMDNVDTGRQLGTELLGILSG